MVCLVDEPARFSEDCHKVEECRVHGDHPVLDDAPAAITPPADGTDEVTLRVGAHRLRDPRPLGSSPGTLYANRSAPTLRDPEEAHRLRAEAA